MRVTGSRHEFVRIDHKPIELPQVRQPLATLQLPPVGSSEGMLRRRAAFPLTSVEDDPHIVPVIKLATQLLVPIQTAAGDNEDQHDGAIYSDGSTRRRCVACHGVRSHPVPVALVGECSIPVL
jgi:hypothetical protein